MIVAGSLAAGLTAAVVLIAAPFIAAEQNVLTGVVLLGFAFGWALLAVPSVRFTDQPQRGAAAPAAFTGVGPRVTQRVRRTQSAQLGMAASAVWPGRLDVCGRGACAAEAHGGCSTSYWRSSLTDLSGKPLIVLTADTGHDAKWQSAQDHLATLSTNSVHRVAKATTHESLIDDEADSAEASAAIHDVVAAVRTSHPLTR